MLAELILLEEVEEQLSDPQDLQHFIKKPKPIVRNERDQARSESSHNVEQLHVLILGTGTHLQTRSVGWSYKTRVQVVRTRTTYMSNWEHVAAQNLPGVADHWRLR